MKMCSSNVLNNLFAIVINMGKVMIVKGLNIIKPITQRCVGHSDMHIQI